MTAKVYAAIGVAMAEIAKEGIGKTRKNAQQGYNFRGVDEVMNALAPVLVKSKLAIMPRFTDRSSSERPTRNGGVQEFVTVRGEFDFMSTEDGSIHTVATYGEAQDSADKATNKAMAAAFKYACFQAFCIPLEGMAEDADSVTEDRAAPARKAEAKNPPARKPAEQTAADDVLDTTSIFRDLMRTMHECETPTALNKWFKNNAVMVEELSQEHRDALREEYREHEANIKQTAMLAA